MVQRVLVALLRAVGHPVTDPWLTGEAQRLLVAEAQQDKLSPSMLLSIHRQLDRQRRGPNTPPSGHDANGQTLHRFFQPAATEKDPADALPTTGEDSGQDAGSTLPVAVPNSHAQHTTATSIRRPLGTTKRTADRPQDRNQ